MIEFIIYFTGFLACWFLVRWMQHDAEYYITWGDIFKRFCTSLFSWVALLLLLLGIGVAELFFLIQDNDPPKWLQ